MSLQARPLRPLGRPEATRSPEARRFDPPQRRETWTATRETRWDALVAEGRRRFGPDADAFERALRHGGMALDGRPLDPRAPAPVHVAAGTQVVVHALLREPEPAPWTPEVLADEDGWVAVSKPPWLPTQRTRASALASLEAELASRLGAPGLRAVHRLDRTTSGVALLARDGAAAARAAGALREPGAERRYLAWVSPPPAVDRFRVAGWLGRVPDPAR
ncbi:MAG: pseudouridine synthase, partial [Myxococcota bacterium]|nr:pseudouridine synthase [Myxococcota bacterium]